MNKQWSETSREFTLNIASGVEVFSTWKPGVSGQLCVKHIDGAFGFLTFEAPGIYLIHSRNQQKWKYSSMVEVVDNGWVVD